MADHMASVRRQGGLPEKEANKELPVLVPEVGYLWGIWNELHAARQSGGMAPNPISYSDIEAFCRMTAEQLEPWEARAIRAVDDAYMAGLADQNTGDAANG